MSKTEKLIVRLLIVAILVLIALVLWFGAADAEILCPPPPPPPQPPTATPTDVPPTFTPEPTDTPAPTSTLVPTDTLEPTETQPSTVTVIPGEFTSVPPPKSTIGPPIARTITPTATATDEKPKADKTPVLFPVTGEARPSGDNTGLWIFGFVLFGLGLLMIVIAKKHNLEY